MKLDLRYNGKLENETSIIFNEVANHLKIPFTSLVEELSEPLKSNLDWWVEGPASRNSLASPFFHYFCALHFIVELINKNYEISEIVVDSLALENIFNQYFRINCKSIKVKHKEKKLKSYFKQVIMPFVKIPLEFYHNIYQFRCALKTKHLNKPIPNKPLTLIDIFVIPGFISKDRYYNGLWENLKDEQKESTFFVPTLVKIPKKKMASAYKELRTADRNFLIKEDYLKIKDLLYALGHYFRMLKMKIYPTIYMGVDISSLVKEELMSMRGYSNAVVGLLNYKFAKRIREQKIKLRLVINWFENQVVDKGWNYGFNFYFNKITIIGYRGLIPARLHLSQRSPTGIEHQSNVLPNKIAVIGKGFIDSTKEFVSELNVVSSPAFRFQHVWNERAAKPNSNYFTVLVALSIMPGESIHIVQVVKDCLKKINIKNIRFWIKPHPTMSEEILKKGLGSSWPEEFILVEGPSSDYIPRSDIMISGMSSICLETITLGIPVIVVENFSGLTFNPLPEEIPQNLWCSCRESEDVQIAIEYYYNRSYDEFSHYKEVGMKIREDYFDPVTTEGVLEFLNISNNKD